MAATFKSLYGYDWPIEMADEYIGLIIGKKWREFKAMGVEFKDPWVPMLNAMKSLFPDEYFKVSEWTEQHVHDWVMEQMLLTWGCASSGKLLMLDEPIYFPDHIGTVREVYPGSVILSATGKPTLVTRIAQQHDHPLYRLKFADGTEVVCGDDHLWTVRYWGRTHWEGPRKTRKGVYGFVTKVKSAKELAELKPGQLRRRRFAIPLTKPAEFNEQKLPVDPYVLGCLIGDGSFVSSSNLTLTSDIADSDVRDNFVKRLPHGGTLKLVGKSTKAYSITPGTDRRMVLTALRDLGLTGHRAWEKFIPEIYKVNSVQNRIDLLAGLLDTDGTVSKQGEIIFTSTSEQLANDVRWMAESLGAWVSIHTKHKTYTYKGVKRTGRPSYQVGIYGLPLDLKKRLFKLSRKRDRLKEVSRHVGYKSIESVELITDRDNYPRETRCITLAETDCEGNKVEGLFPISHFTVTHNSNDTGALILVDWATDPFDTITMVGSTTKDALRIRTWESIERYFGVLKANAKFTIPGKITQTGYAILNDRNADEDNPLAQGSKAGIHGVALNDGGKLQGAHLPYVRLVVDELATIYNHQDILTTIENLQIAKDFRFVGLANPESWSNPSCQYAIPEMGIDSVTVDSGSWRSSFGCFVRHHDGLKSPCIKDPSLSDRFPFLTQKRHVESSLKRCQGNPDAPHFWKMVRGFPLPAGNAGQVVLDDAIALRNHVMDPAPGFEPGTWLGTVAGVDPAWTEHGDSACYARCFIRKDSFGKPYLDFTGGLKRMTLNASMFKQHPAVEQLRNQVLQYMREPYAAPFSRTAIDSSGNQNLADDLIIYAGARDVMAVNFATRASETLLREFDTKIVKDSIYDRGTEAWCVLAEFCRAGQVKGLPTEVLEALTSRRYAANMVKDATGQKVPAGVKYPLRLEDKEEFKKRYHGQSPDACDACALAALAAKERFGLLPFGYVTRKIQPQETITPVVSVSFASTVPSEDMGDLNDGYLDTDDLYS